MNQSYKSIIINQSWQLIYLILFVYAQTRGLFFFFFLNYKYFHDSSPSCIFISKDRRDENGGFKLHWSMRKCVYSMEDLDSVAKAYKANTLHLIIPVSTLIYSPLSIFSFDNSISFASLPTIILIHKQMPSYGYLLNLILWNDWQKWPFVFICYWLPWF